jgi:hypothetical protein
MDNQHMMILVLAVVLLGMCIYLNRSDASENFRFQLVSNMNAVQVKKALQNPICTAASAEYCKKSAHNASGALFNSNLVPQPFEKVIEACGPQMPIDGVCAMKNPMFQLPPQVLLRGGTAGLQDL